MEWIAVELKLPPHRTLVLGIVELYKDNGQIWTGAICVYFDHNKGWVTPYHEKNVYVKAWSKFELAEELLK